MNLEEESWHFLQAHHHLHPKEATDSSCPCLLESMRGTGGLTGRSALELDGSQPWDGPPCSADGGPSRPRLHVPLLLAIHTIEHLSKDVKRPCVTVITQCRRSHAHIGTHGISAQGVSRICPHSYEASEPVSGVGGQYLLRNASIRSSHRAKKTISCSWTNGQLRCGCTTPSLALLRCWPKSLRPTMNLILLS